MRKKRENPEIIFYFFRTIIVKHRNLQCLFICFYLFSTIPPLLPTPDLLKKYQVNAKGHFRNSSELPKEESSPSRKIPSASFRKTKGGEMLLPASSHSSLGLEMYYYANVNFDTEFKKRCWISFFLFSNKKVPYVVIIASLFCNVNCNYAFCKRGERAARGRK